MPVRKIQPPFLKSGDEVAIVSPAFAVDSDKIDAAIRLLESWKLKVRLGKNALKKEGPFAGTDSERFRDLQSMTGNKKIRAIFCSRGGYGILKIIDRIDFSSLKQFPKWYVGFSDVTVLHAWLNEKCNIVSIHGEMPLNYSNPDKSKETLESLHQALFGGIRPVGWEGKFLRKTDVEGEIAGGNLSLIYSLTGTPAEIKTKGRILFIEEVGEYYYHLDRMMTSLKIAGRLQNLSALLVGGFNDMQDGKTPWGKSAEETIAAILRGYEYPVFFNFPAGHVNDNRAFYVGKKVKIELSGRKAVLSYL